MEQLYGFVNDRVPYHVYRLEKSLYGLKQTPKAWFYELKTFLVSFRFEQSQSDTCFFIYSKLGKIIYLLVYVNDIIITSSSSRDIEQFIVTLCNRFLIKDLGDLYFFFGVEITRTMNGLFLSQQNYIH